MYLADGEEADLVAPVRLEGLPAHRHDQVFFTSCEYLRMYLADREKAELVAPIRLEGFPAHRHDKVFFPSGDIPEHKK